MTIGITMTKGKLDNDLSDLALTMQRFMFLANQLNTYCLITPDATLKALGYLDGTSGTPNEIATVKSACHDANQVRLAILNQLTLPPADYTLNLNQLAGDLLPQ